MMLVACGFILCVLDLKMKVKMKNGNVMHVSMDVLLRIKNHLDKTVMFLYFTHICKVSCLFLR